MYSLQNNIFSVLVFSAMCAPVDCTIGVVKWTIIMMHSMQHGFAWSHVQATLYCHMQPAMRVGQVGDTRPTPRKPAMLGKQYVNQASRHGLITICQSCFIIHLHIGQSASKLCQKYQNQPFNLVKSTTPQIDNTPKVLIPQMFYF